MRQTVDGAVAEYMRVNNVDLGAKLNTDVQNNENNQESVVTNAGDFDNTFDQREK